MLSDNELNRIESDTASSKLIAVFDQARRANALADEVERLREGARLLAENWRRLESSFARHCANEVEALLRERE